MSSSEEEEDIMITVACYKLEQLSPRICMCDDINLKRKHHGEFFHLFPDVLKDDQKCFKYF